MTNYKHKPIKKCDKCKELKKIENKGLCGLCYTKHGRPKIECRICKIYKPHQAKGLCSTCYKREGTPLVICKNCGKKRHHHGKGLCNSCYNTVFFYSRIKASNCKKYHNIPYSVYKQLTRECTICGFSNIVDLHHLDKDRTNNSLKNFIGLCPNHHKMLHDQRYQKIMHYQLLKKRQFLARFI